MDTPALVFDLDGTLVDTAPDLLAAMNAVLEQQGRHSLPLDAVRHLVGHGSQATMEGAMRMTGAPAPPEQLPALTEAFIAYYRDHIADGSRPYPGVIPTLEALNSQGARLAVLTNKPQELTDRLLPALGLARYFRAIHGAGRLEVVKPNAAVFHHVLDEIGGVGAGAVMIGDSPTDLLTGRAAKAPVILLTYGYSPEPVETLGADRVTGNFTDIPRLATALLGLA